MKSILALLLFFNFSYSFADIISFACHPDYVMDDFEQMEEEGEPIDTEKEGVISFYYDGNFAVQLPEHEKLVWLEESDLEINDHFDLFTYEYEEKRYVFNRRGEYDSHATLEIQTKDKQTIQTMNCLLSED